MQDSKEKNNKQEPSFSGFGFHDRVMEGLDSMGFRKSTPIQQRAIPAILAGKDLIACAQTGTGKTAAFLLPLIHQILETQSNGLHTLIISPTRELAMQTDQQIQGLGYFAGVSSMPVYGGGDGISWEMQKKSLVQGVDIVVATPGRLIAMLGAKGVDFSKIKTLVLDEADRMLDMGFYDDIMRICSFLPENRQTLLFSATMPPKIETLAKKILNKPQKINLSLSKPAEGIQQQAYYIFKDQKTKLLQMILGDGENQLIIIFSSTRAMVKDLSDKLAKQGFANTAFHSDLEQNDRQDILRRFKNRDILLLVATDVLSRGIDVDNIDMVINYDAPGDPEDYVHRVGRTARAKRKGRAITFITPDERYKFSKIEKLIGYTVEKPDVSDKLGKTPVYDNNKPDKSKKKNYKKRRKKRPSKNFKGKN